jgi:hypothetical protein
MIPREIQTEHWPDRTTYNFPVRPIGPLRFFGLLPMIFAVFWAWMPGQMALSSLRHALQSGGAEWFVAAFTTFFVLTALVPFCLGLFVLAGRTRLVVDRERLIVTEIAGPVRYFRKVRFADIARLEVARRSQMPEGASPFVNSLAQLGGLAAILKNGKKRQLLVAYPRDWIESVTEELSGLMGQQGAVPDITHVDRLSRPEAAVQTDELAPKPGDTRVVLEPRSNGIFLVIPPLGLWKGSKGFFGFAIFWCLFMTVFTGACVFGNSKHQHGDPGMWMFVIGFWMIGLCMLAIAIHFGIRRATITAGGDGLRFEQKGLFGTKNREWRRGEIASLRMGPSGMEVNHVPVMELQVYSIGKKKAGFLGGRPDAELRWLACELRRALDIPAQTENSSEQSLGRTQGIAS